MSILPEIPGWDVDGDGNVNGPLTPQLMRCRPDLSTIVADLFERGGLTADQYDVSDLAGIEVDGYRVASEGGIDSFLAPLMAAFFFDVAEWDGKIRCVRRGGTSVLSVGVDDLAERENEAIGWERVQEAELLRRVSVAYIDPATSYTPTTQKWERRSGTVQARGEATVEVPITATADTAAQIAEKRGKVAWAETEKVLISLPSKFAALTPTDVITLTDADGNAHRIRVMSVEEDSGVLLVEGARERQSAYTGTATGVTAPNPTVPGSGLIGPTVLHAMNLPRLRSSDQEPGAYMAVTGLLSGWHGADIFISADDGITEQFAVRILARATMGQLADDCTDSSEPITVALYNGRTLSSITTEQLSARLNAFAIDSDGTCEVGQFQTATVNGSNYDLTDTHRGRLTASAAHTTGDKFTLLDGAVYFVPIDIAHAGKTLLLRAVSIGTSADANDTIEFVFLPQFTSAATIAFIQSEDREVLMGEDGSYLQEE